MTFRTNAIHGFHIPFTEISAAASEVPLMIASDVLLRLSCFNVFWKRKIRKTKAFYSFRSHLTRINSLSDLALKLLSFFKPCQGGINNAQNL
jgi:hypothetical protein